MTQHQQVVEPKNQPLRAEIEGGRLVMSIGIDTLAFAFEHDPKREQVRGHDCKVIDSAQFAADVLRALEREEEDGSTLLNKMIDAACEDALDDGSIGVDYGASAPLVRSPAYAPGSR